jgi:hypothetical protein
MADRRGTSTTLCLQGEPGRTILRGKRPWRIAVIPGITSQIYRNWPEILAEVARVFAKFHFYYYISYG